MATTSSVGQMTNMKPKSAANPRWRRVVFKISGAALAGAAPNNIDSKVRYALDNYDSTIVEIKLYLARQLYYHG